jgi:guanylate kinase
MPRGGENIMVILSSPSGVGKTTITKKIQQKYQSFKVSISHTTRTARSNEVDGVDYHFVNHKTFKDLIERDQFYEHAKIFENYYGTLKKNVDETIVNNDILFDIDWQGTKQLSKFKKLNFIKIFLIPDNKNELKKRLIKRNQNTDSEIEKRFNAFEEDIKHWNDYDYIVINKNLDACFKQIENIIIEKKNFNLPHKAQ